MQKFNRVASSAVQVHPDCLDFWLIAAYAELDIKGNLFSSRNLMLQALKVNDSKPRFYTEYLKFEVVFLDKLMHRRQLLNGDNKQSEAQDKLDFVDDEDSEEKNGIEGEVKPGEEGRLVEIVVGNLLEKFPENILVLKEVIKIIATSQYVDKSIVAKVKDQYNRLKNESPAALLTLVRHQLSQSNLTSKTSKSSKT